ncbi:hypothetical protein G6011_07269 [Alternaria panax]|uniref:Uncharacterized protein n=1 Tax=Alternaria panax TaxID=48097 RepID=A0AAD4I9E6_9PLEO|nr:hypothetical protein G6011_07269 [Alternaria panax]
MERLCHHGYTYTPNLFLGLSESVCAVCFTEARIAEVKATQAALSRRGGIFGSSNAAGDWCTTNDNIKKWMTHRDWTKQWRRTRLNCWRLVETLEKLQDERCDMAQEWGLDEALYIWEMAKDECSQVPGYGHMKYHASAKEQDKPHSQNTQAILKPAPTEEESSEGDWETVKRRWKTRSQPFMSLLQDEPEPEDTKKTNGVTNGLKHLGFNSENCFKTLTKDDKKVAELIKKPRCILNGDATPKESGFIQETAPSEPRSILKRNSPSNFQSHKSVSIDAQATILPLDTTPVTTTSHHEHTIAEKSHTSPSYNRNSRFYTPSCWFATLKEEPEESWEEKDDMLKDKAERNTIAEEKAAEQGEENQDVQYEAESLRERYQRLDYIGR